MHILIAEVTHTQESNSAKSVAFVFGGDEPSELKVSERHVTISLLISGLLTEISSLPRMKER
jgi:hypothetical protein